MKIIFSKKNRSIKIISIFIISLCFSTISTTVSADIFSGGRTNGIFNAYYDASVSSHGYTTYYDQARQSWNGISSKVSIGKTTSTSDYPDKYYIGDTATEGLLGRHIPYKKNWLGSIVVASNSDTWLYSTVSIYDNTMDQYNMTQSERISNATGLVKKTV